MNKAEFNQAFKLAASGLDLSTVDTSHLFGCGLKDFAPVVTTLDAVAALIRWQALQFNGQWDQEALNEVAYIARKKFTLVDGGKFTVLEGEFTPAEIAGIRATSRIFAAV